MVNSLSRKKDYRKSLMRNLATSLVLYEEIKTTKAKAKVLKSIVEHLIAIAKNKPELSARRRLLGFLFDENATKKIFEVYRERYKKLNSGFIRVYHLGPRLGDSAEMVMLKMRNDLAAPKEDLNKKEITKEIKDAKEPKEESKTKERPGRKTK